MAEHISYSRYAKSLGVAQPSISGAVRRGALVATADGIDPNHPTNLKYEGSIRTRRGALPKDVLPQPSPPVHEPPPPTAADFKNPPGKRRGAPIKPPAAPGGFKSKVDYDIEKLEVQTAKLRAELANNLGVTVLRAMVDRAFAQIHSAAVNFLLPLGARLAPVLAGICGVTKAETILEIQTKIDEEILRALGLIKDVENFSFVEDAPEVEDADAS